MARRRHRNSPEDAIAGVVGPLAGIVALYAYISPTFWASVKPWLIGGGLLVLVGFGVFVWFKLRPGSTPDTEQDLPERAGSSRQSAAASRRRSARTPSVPQPSPALEAAIQSAVNVAGSVRPAEAPKAFDVEVVRRLDWLAFEHLVVDLLQSNGFEARKTPAGPDGGVDIELRRPGAEPGSTPEVVVQCKARSADVIRVDKVREIFGVMSAMNARAAVLVCNTSFTEDARTFAKQNPKLKLGDLSWVMSQIGKAPQVLREAWEVRYLTADYDVPSCPACEIKLVRRRGCEIRLNPARRFG
jgi:restriction system protein